MADLRLGLIECDHVADGLRGIAGDYADMHEALIGRHDPSIEVVRHDLVGGRRPSEPTSCDGWIVTGSRWSVYDTEPWIAELLDVIRSTADAGRPLVGICFGHQAIAEALGGEVTRADSGWGVGVHTSRVHRRRPWMDPPAERVRLIYSHQDQIRRVPDGGDVLADNPHCPIAMFDVGDLLLGIQGHPEFTRPYLDALMGTRTDRIPADTLAAAQASLEEDTDEDVVIAWIVRFLADHT